MGQPALERDRIFCGAQLMRGLGSAACGSISSGPGSPHNGGVAASAVSWACMCPRGGAHRPGGNRARCGQRAIADHPAATPDHAAAARRDPRAGGARSATGASSHNWRAHRTPRSGSLPRRTPQALRVAWDASPRWAIATSCYLSTARAQCCGQSKSHT